MVEKELADRIFDALAYQRSNKVERGLYWETQIAFAYNSNRIEGGTLTLEQTREVYETDTIGGAEVAVDDVIEMRNHFLMFDHMLDTIDQPLSKDLIKSFQGLLKAGTGDAMGQGEGAGEWKTIPNAVGNLLSTTPPPLVDEAVGRLLESYGHASRVGYREIAGFHAMFEQIHPFQDGNGRTGRMIAFRECLVHGLVPFIVSDDSKQRYYRGLQRFGEQETLLIGYFEEMAQVYQAKFEEWLMWALWLPRGLEVSYGYMGGVALFPSFCNSGNRVDDACT